MSETVLITGGAGFIGSHLADELVDHGYRVRVLDNLCAQVHPQGRWPAYLNGAVEKVRGDVRDAHAVEAALDGVDRVVHLAAMVGVGQSMYQLHDYTDVNQGGTAVLLEAIMNRGGVQRLVTASSMSIYGEGLYRDGRGRLHRDVERQAEQLRRSRWEPTGADGSALAPVPTAEDKTPALASNYALSKYAQERMCLIVGGAYGVPTVALRFFNVYGPRQCLSNPYTGVLAIFASRLLNDRPPLIYEDGRQQRDFVSVHDVARACRLALVAPEAPGGVFNVGSGAQVSVLELGQRLAELMDKRGIEPVITGKYRVGDIRHCFADIRRARRCLGYEPQVGLDEGMASLTRWLRGQVAEDHVEAAHSELATRGLTV